MIAVRRTRDPEATREITVKLQDRSELDECMACSRPAVGGMAWARYCRYHAAQRDPIEVDENMGYLLYRRRIRGEE